MSDSNFEIRPGSTDSAVILHVPHSSRLIPAKVRAGIVLSEQLLQEELDEVTDTHTDLLALQTLEKLDLLTPTPWLFVNRRSRLVIDPERFPDEREVMNKVGMGAVYLKGTSGAQLRPADFDGSQLLNEFFYPYSQALSSLVAARLASCGYALIIDIHSYRPKQHSNAINHGQMRPAMCLGSDEFHTPDWLKELFVKEFEVLGDCLENQPYSGTYIPLDFFQSQKRVWSLMMETRADTFLDANLNPHEGLAEITQALARFISRADQVASSK